MDRRTPHRLLTIAAATGAALALSAAPALAGSDGCSGDCQDENSPAPVVPVAPLPSAPQLEAPAPDTTPALQRTRAPRRRHVVHASTISQTVPRGAVAAGAGGTAPGSPDGLLAGLASGALILLVTGGGLVARSRS
jgi:hypothetical protein